MEPLTNNCECRDVFGNPLAGQYCVYQKSVSTTMHEAFPGHGLQVGLAVEISCKVGGHTTPLFLLLLSLSPPPPLSVVTR